MTADLFLKFIRWYGWITKYLFEPKRKMLKYKSETQNNALFMKLFIKHCLSLLG